MSVELNLTFKDDERKLNKEFNIYDIITLDINDPTIQECLKDVQSEFKGEPDHIILKATMVIK